MSLQAMNGHGRPAGARVADCRGFTLPELLVTLLVLGVLAAIGLPQFLEQRTKAQDAGAKALAAAGAAALQEHATLEDGFDVSADELARLAPELRHAPAWTLDAAPRRYELRVTSRSGTWFSVGRPDAEAPLERDCGPRGAGGCGISGAW